MVTLTTDTLMKLETWEVAFYLIRDSDDLYDLQVDLQKEFEVNFDDMESVIDLPTDSFRDFKEKVILRATEVLDSNREALYQKVCVEFEYCRKRNTLTATALEAAVISLDIAQTGGVAYLVFFGFKRGFFDELCGCDK